MSYLPPEMQEIKAKDFIHKELELKFVNFLEENYDKYKCDADEDELDYSTRIIMGLLNNYISMALESEILEVEDVRLIQSAISENINRIIRGYIARQQSDT